MSKKRSMHDVPVLILNASRRPWSLDSASRGRLEAKVVRGVSSSSSDASLEWEGVALATRR